MVRQKNRWLLVRFDFESDILSSCSIGDATASAASNPKSSKKRKLQSASSGSSNNLSESASSSSTAASQSIRQITSTDIYRALQEAITQSFGLIGAATAEVQVRIYDPELRLAIIKTTRDKYPNVRSSLALLTQIKQGGDLWKVVASTIAVSGSARTARSAARDEIQKRFYEQNSLGDRKGGQQQRGKRSRIIMDKNLQELEDRLEKIDSGL